MKMVKDTTNDILVLIAQAHSKSTPGKRSPDGKFREYAYSREICKMIVEKLYRHNIKSIIINPELEKDVKLSIQAERANSYYNQYKNEYNNIILISPHVNAAATPGWSEARGFSVYVYNKASKNSRTLAKIISDLAYNKYDLKGDRWVPNNGYFEANYAILRLTKMPAILSENLFQTNRLDVDYLLSKEGKETISDLHVNSILKYIHFNDN